MALAEPSLPDHYRLGLVEGFFGREWSWEARHMWAGFLADTGFNSYLYAPKGDRSLRALWREPFSPEHQAHLASLAATCRRQDIDFGIGLSPWELYRHFDETARNQLATKISQINDIGPHSLCILFDDMPGDFAGIADAQCEIMRFVMQQSDAAGFMFCPTYYSYDPKLARIFGAEPAGYLDTLGARLPARVEVFWTGPQVISTEYPVAHLQEVGERLQRKPLIWDNYPVNDSKVLSDFLFLAPAVRDTQTLLAHASGQMVNPMNQPWLSRFPVLGLAMQYATSENPAPRQQDVFAALASPALATALSCDIELFSKTGYSQLSPSDKAGLETRYQALLPDPVAAEVLDWLAGGYVFDPACLT